MNDADVEYFKLWLHCDEKKKKKNKKYKFNSLLSLVSYDHASCSRAIYTWFKRTDSNAGFVIGKRFQNHAVQSSALQSIVLNLVFFFYINIYIFI